MDVLIISLIGFFLSVYAYSVEKRSKSRGYKAACDINSKISCTKNFNSKYGRLFGISNSLIGMIFYCFVIVLMYIKPEAILYLASLSVFGSLYLAYLQFFKVRSFCIVCISVYLVNILLLIFSLS